MLAYSEYRDIIVLVLKLSKNITNLPIMSLRTGGKVGMASQPIINPNNLKIEGWHCQDIYSNSALILPSLEVREIVHQGIAVNDHDAMTDAEDLVRLKDIIDINFELIGKKVVTTNKRRLGKVADYALDPDSMRIQKLYVNRPVYKSLTEGQLTIDRTQIVEMTNKKIVVKDSDIKVESSVPVTAPAT